LTQCWQLILSTINFIINPFWLFNNLITHLAKLRYPLNKNKFAS